MSGGIFLSIPNSTGDIDISVIDSKFKVALFELMNGKILQLNVLALCLCTESTILASDSANTASIYFEVKLRIQCTVFMQSSVAIQFADILYVIPSTLRSRWASLVVHHSLKSRREQQGICCCEISIIRTVDGQ